MMSVFGEFHGLNALYSFQLSVLWPFLPIASGLVNRDKRTVLCQTAQWAEGRRAMHHLTNGAALTYGEWQELESAQLLAAYLLQPALWHKHHFRYSNSVMHWVVLGERHLKPTPNFPPLLRSMDLRAKGIDSSSDAVMWDQKVTFPRIMSRYWRQTNMRRKNEM